MVCAWTSFGVGWKIAAHRVESAPKQRQQQQQLARRGERREEAPYSLSLSLYSLGLEDKHQRGAACLHNSWIAVGSDKQAAAAARPPHHTQTHTHIRAKKPFIFIFFLYLIFSTTTAAAAAAVVVVVFKIAHWFIQAKSGVNPSFLFLSFCECTEVLSVQAAAAAAVGYCLKRKAYRNRRPFCSVQVGAFFIFLLKK